MTTTIISILALVIVYKLRNPIIDAFFEFIEPHDDQLPQKFISTSMYSDNAIFKKYITRCKSVEDLHYAYQLIELFKKNHSANGTVAENLTTDMITRYQEKEAELLPQIDIHDKPGLVNVSTPVTVQAGRDF